MRKVSDSLMQELRNELRIEVNDHWNTIEETLIAFEKNPHSEKIDQIKNAIHSIKGSARAAGCMEYSSLVHKIEDYIIEHSPSPNPTPFVTALLSIVDIVRLVDVKSVSENQLQQIFARMKVVK